MSIPVTIEAARERARRMFDRHSPTWATTGGDDASLNIPLHPPTERDALADLPGARAWVETWASSAKRFQAEVQWAERSWSRVGSQWIPERLIATGPGQIADLAGRSPEWRILSDRISLLREHTGTGTESVSALRSQARKVGALEDRDFLRLLDVLTWLRTNPTSGRLVRELPIRGVDSKWIEARVGLVEALHRAGTGHPTLGLRHPLPLVRMRALDPAYRLGGVQDVSAPVNELAALTWTPQRVLVVENLNTFLALPDLLDTIVLAGNGYDVDRIALIPWARRVTYWGDLDSHGFAILNRLRSHGVEAPSALMDSQTLEDHRDLCVTEEKPNTSVLPLLSTEEQGTLNALSAAGNLRLEQERIPLTYALQRLLTV